MFFAYSVGLFGFGIDLQRTHAAQGRMLRSIDRHLDHTLLALIADGVSLGLRWHQVEPPLHHAVALGEEAMTADIHAVTLIANGAGDATYLI